MTASFSDIRKYFKELVSLATGTGKKRSYHNFFPPTNFFFFLCAKADGLDNAGMADSDLLTVDRNINTEAYTLCCAL